MATVKEGQTWVSDFVRNSAAQMGFDVRTFWRHPDNGMDWKLEVTAFDTEATVQIPIWFLDLKRVDQGSKVKTKLEGLVKKGLEDLQAQLN